ncbi:MAG: ACT domain-containing protein [Candidatus Aenigmarchaeota archaeon]|nr:ACT domain-containing protein [Candidatus Aenigmarchaeota archaeon]
MKLPYHIPKDLLSIFSKTKLNVQPGEYLIVRLPLKYGVMLRELSKFVREPFFNYTVEPQEITLVVHERDWSNIGRDFIETQIEHGYNIITMDVTVDLNVIGYLAVISRLLADVGVPIMVVSGHRTDHILIKKYDLQKAIFVLQDLINSCKNIVIV